MFPIKADIADRKKECKPGMFCYNCHGHVCLTIYLNLFVYHANVTIGYGKKSLFDMALSDSGC